MEQTVSLRSLSVNKELKRAGEGPGRLRGPGRGPRPDRSGGCAHPRSGHRGAEPVRPVWVPAIAGEGLLLGGRRGEQRYFERGNPLLSHSRAAVPDGSACHESRGLPLCLRRRRLSPDSGPFPPRGPRMGWSHRKYKRLQGSRKAHQCLKGITLGYPRMFAHWQWVTRSRCSG